jgi:hypothetical protein
MLEQFLKPHSPLLDSRSGPAGPFLDGFAEVLVKGQYAVATVGKHLHAAAHLVQGFVNSFNKSS